jgi:exonuclease III
MKELPDVILLQELPIKQQLQYPKESYKLIMPECKGLNHTGILIVNHLISKITVIPFQMDNLIGISFDNMDIICIYNPIKDPNNQTMSQLRKWVHNSPKRTLIAGDFNAHSDMWDKNFRKPQNEQDKYVENVIIDEELEICNNESKVTFLSNKNSSH